MVKINSTSNINKVEIPKNPEKEIQNKETVQDKAELKKDSFSSDKNLENKGIEANKVNLFPQEKEESRGFKVKSMNIYYGVMPWNSYGNSNIHIKQPGLDTDVVISGVKHDQRTSMSYLAGKPRFAPDEPQFDAGVGVQFENKFGIDLNLKHNKIITDGYDQEVHFKGKIHGQQIDETAPLNSFINHYELTKGNTQISLQGTYTVDLPAPKNHKFSFITKAGPSAIVSYSRAEMKTPDGNFERNMSSLNLVGFGGIIENGLRYELPKSMGRVSVELSHSLSYLNFTNYPVLEGTGSHSQFANQFSIKLGKSFDFSKK